MGEYRYNYTNTVAYPIDTVWAALHKTADLDLASGTTMVDRISDSEWVVEEKETKLIMTNKASYDEVEHRVHVDIHSSTKKQVDEINIQAIPEGDGTKLVIEEVIRGGVVAIAAVKLLGAMTLKKVFDHVTENVEALCQGSACRTWGQDDMVNVAEERFFG